MTVYVINSSRNALEKSPNSSCETSAQWRARKRTLVTAGCGRSFKQDQVGLFLQTVIDWSAVSVTCLTSRMIVQNQTQPDLWPLTQWLRVKGQGWNVLQVFAVQRTRRCFLELCQFGSSVFLQVLKCNWRRILDHIFNNLQSETADFCSNINRWHHMFPEWFIFLWFLQNLVQTGSSAVHRHVWARSVTSEAAHASLPVLCFLSVFLVSERHLLVPLRAPDVFITHSLLSCFTYLNTWTFGSRQFILNSLYKTVFLNIYRF